MLTLASCQNGKKFAENDFKASMEALQKGDFSKLNSDKESVEALQVFSGAYKKLTYKINKVTEESKDKVLVNVTMKYPDLSEAGKIFQNKLLKETQKLEGKSDAEIEKQSMQFLKESIDEKLNDKNVKYNYLILLIKSIEIITVKNILSKLLEILKMLWYNNYCKI